MEHWDEIAIALAPIITGLSGWLMGKRMKDEATAIKTRAEAKRILRESRETIAQVDSPEARSMERALNAWEALFAVTNSELDEIRGEQRALHAEYLRVLDELRTYKRGVDILINQLRRLGHDPEWDPNHKETK